jgi:pimeloyl-ACP methyl ester carboxylesterase
LLLIMGLGMASDAWDSLPERLAERFHVLAVDNRGMGQSTATRGGFRIGDLADDAVRVLDAEGLAQASVFGISMGGMIAQELALRHPARVRALVLGATFGSQRRSHKPRLSVARDLLLVSLFFRRPERMARLLVSDEFFALHRERFAAWLARLSQPRRSVARRQILAIARHEAEDRLAQLRIPTLIVSGDLDRLVPVENSRRLASVIPRARLVELPGAAHAFPFERTDETVRVVTEHCLAGEHGTSGPGAPRS